MIPLNNYTFELVGKKEKLFTAFPENLNNIKNSNSICLNGKYSKSDTDLGNISYCECFMVKLLKFYRKTFLPADI